MSKLEIIVDATCVFVKFVDNNSTKSMVLLLNNNKFTKVVKYKMYSKLIFYMTEIQFNKIKIYSKFNEKKLNNTNIGFYHSEDGRFGLYFNKLDHKELNIKTIVDIINVIIKCDTIKVKITEKQLLDNLFKKEKFNEVGFENAIYKLKEKYKKNLMEEEKKLIMAYNFLIIAENNYKNSMGGRPLDVAKIFISEYAQALNRYNKLKQKCNKEYKIEYENMLVKNNNYEKSQKFIDFLELNKNYTFSLTSISNNYFREQENKILISYKNSCSFAEQNLFDHKNMVDVAEKNFRKLSDQAAKNKLEDSILQYNMYLNKYKIIVHEIEENFKNKILQNQHNEKKYYSNNDINKKIECDFYEKNKFNWILPSFYFKQTNFIRNKFFDEKNKLLKQIIWYEKNGKLIEFKYYGKDYAKTLGVEKNVVLSEVNKAYKRLALIHHPDKSKVNSDEVFKALQYSYEQLKKRFKKKPKANM